MKKITKKILIYIAMLFLITGALIILKDRFNVQVYTIKVANVTPKGKGQYVTTHSLEETEDRRVETWTETKEAYVEYSEPITKDSIHKSKQFLGMLRNAEGKCSEDDCYTSENLEKKDPKAIKCTEEAEFDEEGTNVTYQIPGTNVKEAPLNKLESGMEMLYAIMQSNYDGYKEWDKIPASVQETYNKMQSLLAEGDESHKEDEYEEGSQKYRNAYTMKMQGTLEHLRYLMTFPANEEGKTVKQLVNNDLPIIEVYSARRIQQNNNQNINNNLPSSLTGNSVTEKIWNYFRSLGYSENAVAGMLGNVQQESSFNPAAVNPNGPSYGLFQWQGDRWNRYKAYADSKGVDWTDVQTQLEFAAAELEGKGRFGAESQIQEPWTADYNRWLNASSAEEASDAWGDFFERYRDSTAGLRRQYSRAWYNQFSGRSVPSGNSGGTTSSSSGRNGNSITGNNSSLATDALSEINSNKYSGSKYLEWVGGRQGGEWCSSGVSYMLGKAGKLSQSTAKNNNFWESTNLWKYYDKQERTYSRGSGTPQPGDIIFFNYDYDTENKFDLDHVGIVTKVENGRVYTAEFNHGGVNGTYDYSMKNKKIHGYARP